MEGDLNRRCHNQISENVELICPSCPPAEDCSSLWMNLFSAFLTSEVLFVQSISVALHSEWLTLEVLNVRFSSIFVCLYSLFSYTSPSANMYSIDFKKDKKQTFCVFFFFFLTREQVGYQFGWSGFVSLPQILHKCFGPVPDTGQRRANVLVVQCPTSLYFKDVIGSSL